jgi:hypothetical protein
MWMNEVVFLYQKIINVNEEHIILFFTKKNETYIKDSIPFFPFSFCLTISFIVFINFPIIFHSKLLNKKHPTLSIFIYTYIFSVFLLYPFRNHQILILVYMYVSWFLFVTHLHYHSFQFHNKDFLLQVLFPFFFSPF